MLYATVRDRTQLHGITNQSHLHLFAHENGMYGTLSDITVPPRTKMLFYETEELLNKGYEVVYPKVLYEGFYPNCKIVLRQFIPTAVNIENQLPMYNCIRLHCEKTSDVLIKHVSVPAQQQQQRQQRRQSSPPAEEATSSSSSSRMTPALTF
uniref:Uncharacterized protein n=1 Tax=Panulirus argus virus 1 TaxID=380624 RepID=A0A6G9HF06_9VIRU|nr:hypothetical protein [Panulirus argus virus 1]